MEHHVLYKTLHGSRLYGLSTDDSDYDYYTVLDKVKSGEARYAKQKISGQDDSMTVDFGIWIGMCQGGVPQALEAIFSEMPVHDEIQEFRNSFRVTLNVADRYLRTIKAFCYTQTPKSRRHGLRLAFNLHDLSLDGRFNPTLSQNQIDYCNDQMGKDCDSVLAKAMTIALDRLPPGW